jgi:heme oxygenase
MALKELIKESHDKAEAHPFVTLLLSGKMPGDIYAEYLANQSVCYAAVESIAGVYGLLHGLDGLTRARLIAQDAAELGGSKIIHPSTREYVEYVLSVPADRVLAHIYVRHFADMYGGQLIKRVAPGSCLMYEFDDRAGLIAKVRERLTDDLAEEANRVFDFALRLFDEIADVHDL